MHTLSKRLLNIGVEGQVSHVHSLSEGISVFLYIMLGITSLMMLGTVIGTLLTSHREDRQYYSLSGSKWLLLVLELMATGLVILLFHFVDLPYRFYINLSRIYEIMVSNIGLTAVIAAAGLGVSALVSPPYEVDVKLYWTDKQRKEFQESGEEAEIERRIQERQKLSDEKRRFAVFFCSTFALSIVVILSVCYYTGITGFTEFSEGYAYNGQMSNNMAEGYGTLYSIIDEKPVYRGWFKNNQYNGEGIQYKKRVYSDGTERYEYAYIGHFENNQYNGQGIEFLFDNDHNYIGYVGEFRDGVYCGQGKWYNYREEYVGDEVDLSTIDQDIMNTINTDHLFLRYEGAFDRNMYNGKGLYYGSMETDWGEVRYLKYDGYLFNNRFEGEGKLFFPEHIVKYEGGFSDDQYWGYGTEYVLNDDRTDHRKWYEGWFRNGLYDGEGTLYDQEENPIRKGIFSEGEYVGDTN